jgi:primosomal protein N''
MQAILDKLQENLQLIYRKAVDADNLLDSFQKDGKGKFQTIFADSSPFKTRAKRFEPYVAEVCENMDAFTALDFANTDKAQIEQDLSVIVMQIEQLLSTLVQFKDSLKSQ